MPAEDAEPPQHHNVRLLQSAVEAVDVVLRRMTSLSETEYGFVQSKVAARLRTRWLDCTCHIL